MIVVTNTELCKDDFFARIEKIARGNPEAILLREKSLSEDEFRDMVIKCKVICEKYRINLIINHQEAVANDLNIQRIHLSYQEFLEKSSRGIAFRYVGVSVHTKEEALQAEKLGADYLIAGHIYATDCKKGLPPRGTKFLEELCGCVRIPVYAIGGISKEKIEEVGKANAFGFCIMSELMKADDPEELVKEYEQVWKKCIILKK